MFLVSFRIFKLFDFFFVSSCLVCSVCQVASSCCRLFCFSSILSSCLDRLVVFRLFLGCFKWFKVGFYVVVGGFVWVRLFELVRTCFGSFRFVLIALGCVGLCWAVVVVTSCSRCLRMYRVASIFQSIFCISFFQFVLGCFW